MRHTVKYAIKVNICDIIKTRLHLFDLGSVYNGWEVTFWKYVFQRTKQLGKEPLTNFHKLAHVVTV